MKTVVTLTSWKKRINCLYKFLYVFFKTQTVLPDIFYIWLSIEEFPNKEKDLDSKLLDLISKHNITFKWLEGNDRVFKRWNVYPEHYEDLVISIDEDRVYPFDLIDSAKSVKQGTVLNIFCDTEDSPNKVYKPYDWFCGQCVIPPNTYPKELLDPQIKELRKTLNIPCDEVFTYPFLKKNNVEIINEIKWAPVLFLDSLFSDAYESALSLEFKNKNFDKYEECKKFVEYLNKFHNMKIKI